MEMPFGLIPTTWSPPFPCHRHDTAPTRWFLISDRMEPSSRTIVSLIDVDFLSVLEKPVLDDEAEINGRNNIPDAEDPRSGH